MRNRNKDSEYDYIDETSEEDCSQAHCLGLQRECTKFLEKTKNFVDKNVPTEDAHDIYIKLFNKVHDFDEHIAERYDDLGGSYYYLTVYSLYVEGVLTDEDIREFDDELYNRLRETKRSFQEE